MGRILRYLISGVNKSIIIGVPNFNENNQFEDAENISNDFQFSRSSLTNESKTTNSKKTKRIRTKN